MLQEEEQIALLGKMLLHSVDHLTVREREVYDRLVESLSKRLSRLHRLERQTEKLRRVPGTPDMDSREPDQSKKGIVKNLLPDDVVKLFIECWNTGDFESEYYCLSRDAAKGGRNNLPFPDYISSRRQRWEDRDLAGITRKRLVEVSSSEMRGNRAVIHCLEIHTTRQEEITLWRQYELIYEEGGWRIIDFSTRRKINRPLSSKAT